MKGSGQFSIAVHLMAGLAAMPEGRTSGQLSKSVNACPSFLRRTMSKLSKAGLVRTSMGRGGACTLARPAERISLLDVYKAVEAPKAIAVHDYPAQAACALSCGFKPALTKVLERAQSALENDLARTTLAGFVSGLKS